MKRISVEHLSKVYQLGAQVEKDLSFRELLFSQVSSLWSPSQPKQPFYALNDVSFDVEEGEVLGIIGKNGSGKSTLLKILSRITSPTSGKATIRGRVASLLEVGTGFHAELSGRENIYLSGVILGMKRWEISTYFDEIVSFSGIEQFLNVPVKKYSSGMRLRLAFAVAAYLRPEVLLIDEVLAVGDYEFEKKCIQSMSELGKAGRTILFVSHNLVAVKKLCSRVLVLNHGQEQYIGDPIQATAIHLGTQKATMSAIDWGNSGLQLGSILSLQSVKVLSMTGEGKEQFLLSEPVGIEIFYQCLEQSKQILLVLSFYDESEDLLFSSSKILEKDEIILFDSKERLFCIVPKHIFQEGIVTIGVEFFDLGLSGTLSSIIDSTLFSEEALLSFVMKEEDSEKKLRRDGLWNDKKAKIKPLLEWQ